MSAGYYGADLSLVHHLGFGGHAGACAPGILRLLEPVRGGLVVEIGCGSGLLTKHLTDAGHRVLATDASAEMLTLARQHAPEASFGLLVLPDDPVPECDAVVSTGHALSYLPDEESIDRALVAIAGALRPGGVLALDLLDLAYGETRVGAPPYVGRGDGWLIVTEYEQPAPARFVRAITTFVANTDGSWRRGDERHTNVLIDTAAIAGLLASHRVEASVEPAFGDETLPAGLVAVVGERPV